MAGPIVLEEAPFDALGRRKDRGDNRRVIGTTWKVSRAVS